MPFAESIRSTVAALRYKLAPKWRRSYSQCGEDIILQRIMRELRISRPRYVDIGSNDPVVFNNTYCFYHAGARGLCIEPNPALVKKTVRKRPGDICLQIGIGMENGFAPYFMLDNHMLNTFSEEEARNAERLGYRIARKVQMPMRTANDVLKETGYAKADLLSLDVEGLDLDILRSIDWDTISMRVICVETRSFSSGRPGREASPIASFLADKGYEPVASTVINTIFVSSKAWRDTKRP